MADPHNPKRYGETWPQHKIDAWGYVLEVLKPLVVFSGGWAWHFLSPKGHVEFKHAHDHKDCDLMVPKRNVGTVVGLLKSLGFQKVRTKYDRLPSEEDFRRYEKNTTVETQVGGMVTELRGVRMTIDFFVKDVPTLEARGGWLVVRPDELLTYYSRIHSSTTCWSVLAAKQLFDNGGEPEDLLNNPALVAYPFLR